MTIKEKVNPDETTAAIGGGTAAAGVVGYATKCGALKVAEGVTTMIASASEIAPVVKMGANLGAFLVKVVCPEVAIIGGLIMVGVALYEVN